jgi:hypothetical protein
MKKLYSLGLLIFIANLLTSCDKCVECIDCQGNNNLQSEEVCRSEFASQERYENYIKELQTKGRCICR